VSDAAPSATGRRDDRLALATIALGAGIALLGLRAPLTLLTGVALGLAGALFAVRGGRRVPSPRLMTAALVCAVLAVVAVALLGLWEEWIVGQRLSEGASPDLVTALMRPYVRAAAALRSLALFAALAMLLGAAVTRVSTPAENRAQPSGK
jgi:drug/metabolite transporter (DMT)-like permease